MTAKTVVNEEGLEVIEYDKAEKPAITYEHVFGVFKEIAKAHPDMTAAAVAIATADRVGISVQHVIESCATVHAANAARGNFERNE